MHEYAFQAPLWMHMLHCRLCKPLRVVQHTVAIRSGGGALQGVLPLVRQRVMGLVTLQAVDFGVCDYNAPVASNEVLLALAAERWVREHV